MTSRPTDRPAPQVYRVAFETSADGIGIGGIRYWRHVRCGGASAEDVEIALAEVERDLRRALTAGSITRYSICAVAGPALARAERRAGPWAEVRRGFEFLDWMPRGGTAG